MRPGAVAPRILAGAAATYALARFERLATRWLGAAPVFSPERIAARALTRESVAKAAGAVLRAGYGPALGLAWTSAPAWRRLQWPLRALLAGVGTFAVELFAMPVSGATPPLSTWSRSEVALLLGQTLVFGAVLAAGSALAEQG
ncbi:MAG TPA: hypothetical protein VGK67_08845 [Myxococcales bacterium]